jgi:hypothetical protein
MSRRAVLKIAAATPAVLGLGVGLNAAACEAREKPPSPDHPLFEVGLYSWGEIQTFKTQTQKMGTAILRLGGPLTDAEWKACLDIGVKVIYTVGFDADTSTDALIASVLANCDTALRRYGPGGSYWADNPTAPNNPIEAVEILNEPNVTLGMDAQKAALYAAVLIAAYDHVKSSFPTVTVVGFSASDASAAAGNWVPLVFSADRRVATSFDVFSIHFYTGNTPPDQTIVESWGSWRVDTNIAMIRNTLASYGVANKPWWITEIGYRISHADGGYFSDTQPTVTLAQQAAYNIRMDLLAARHGIPRVYHMFIDDADNFNGGYFVNSIGAARPVAVATAHLISLLRDATSMDVISEDPFIYRFHTPAATVTAAWSQTPQTLAIPVSGTTTVTDQLGNVLTTTTQSSYSAALSETPIFLKS